MAYKHLLFEAAAPQIEQHALTRLRRAHAVSEEKSVAA
jgi:hypothetical protein